MKTHLARPAIIALAALAFGACSKPAESASENSVQNASGTQPATPSLAGIPAAAIAKAENVAAKVEAKYADLATDASELYAAAVTKAKTLIGEQKYTDALAALDSLKGVALSAAQQKTVDDLREQITKALDLLKQSQALKSLTGK